MDTFPHAHMTPPDGASWSSPRASVFTLFSDVLRRRVWVVRAVLVTVTAALLLTFLRPRTYTSSATFLPQARRGQSSLNGLAAQLGLSVPGGDATQTPQFYVDLLRSRPILHAAVDTRYAFGTDSGAVSAALADVYSVPAGAPAVRRDAAARRLADDIGVTSSTRTGVITLKVNAPHPQLAQQVVARLIALLNEYNLNTRKSQATAERAFTEQRLAEARAELRRSEDRLQDFLLRNREFRLAPTLALDHNRLSRDVTFRHQTYGALAQAYEQARIEEVRDTPVISVVEEPAVPIRPDPRGTVRNVLLGTFAGLLLGALVAMVAAHLDRLRASRSADFLEFSRLRGEAVRGLRSPHRAVARLFTRAPGDRRSASGSP